MASWKAEGAVPRTYKKEFGSNEGTETYMRMNTLTNMQGTLKANSPMILGNALEINSEWENA